MVLVLDVIGPGNSPVNPIVPVYIDDTPETQKEKLFASVPGIALYPPLVKLNVNVTEGKLYATNMVEDPLILDFSHEPEGYIDASANDLSIARNIVGAKVLGTELDDETKEYITLAGKLQVQAVKKFQQVVTELQQYHRELGHEPEITSVSCTNLTVVTPVIRPGAIDPGVTFAMFETSKEFPIVRFGTTSKVDTRVDSSLFPEDSAISGSSALGLLVRTNIGLGGGMYASVTVQSNGAMKCGISKIRNSTVLEAVEIAESVLEKVSKVLGLDHKPSRIYRTTVEMSTARYISTEFLREMGMNRVFASNVFALKELESDPSKVSLNVHGLILNVEPNPYSLGSSIVTFNSAKSLDQIKLAMERLWPLARLSPLDPRKRAKTRGTIKDLRESGVKIDAKKCQKPRQPRVYAPGKEPADNPGPPLLHESKMYVCPAEYAYPGFSDAGDICCFKHDQSASETYLRHASGNATVVHPSNTFVDTPVGRKHLLKDENLDTPKYYYLDGKNLVGVVPSIDTDEIDWLDPVPHTFLTRVPKKAECRNGPVFDENWNADCGSRRQLFYTDTSAPCCMYPENAVASTDPGKLKGLIINSGKLLGYKRAGTLPIQFSTVLGQSFYRMGTSKRVLSDQSKMYTDATKVALSFHPEFESTFKLFVVHVPMTTTKFSSEPNWNDATVMCSPDTVNDAGNAIVVFRIGSAMELLVNVDADKNVTAIFRIESLPIQKIVEFKSASCKLVEKYPENWDYKRLVDPDKVQGLKRVSSDFAVYVPGAVLVPVTVLSEFRPTESLRTYKLPFDEFSDRVSALPSAVKYEILGVAVNSSRESVAALTSSGVFVPLVPGLTHTGRTRILKYVYHDDPSVTESKSTAVMNNWLGIRNVYRDELESARTGLDDLDASTLDFITKVRDGTSDGGMSRYTAVQTVANQLAVATGTVPGWTHKVIANDFLNFGTLAAPPTKKSSVVQLHSHEQLVVKKKSKITRIQTRTRT